MAKERILIVDDNEPLRSAMVQYFTAQHYEVAEAGSASEALRVAEGMQPHAVIVDYSLPDANGLTVTDRVLATDPATVVMVLTAFGNIDLAVQAIKRGAEQFLTKPVELKVLGIVLKRALAQKQAARVGQAFSRNGEPDPFLGKSSAIRQIQSQVQKLAASDRPILLSGESGTGKTILARWIHSNSTRSAAPFVDLNCAGFARELLESELFGHEKGAFTGAVVAKEGLFEVANKGTVFLDEIGDMDLQLQPKLLKVLEEKRLRRVGDTHDRLIDVRLIAASHHDLVKLSDESRFRKDLYFRISTLPVRLVPLRERREDIPEIARQLIGNLSRELGRKELELTIAAERALLDYAWPGNIRELKNVLERAILLANRDAIDLADLSFDTVSPSLTKSAPHASADHLPSKAITLAEVERAHIQKVLIDEGGQVTAAAKRLGISRGTLYAKLKEIPSNGSLN